MQTILSMFLIALFLSVGDVDDQSLLRGLKQAKTLSEAHAVIKEALGPTPQYPDTIMTDEVWWYYQLTDFVGRQRLSDIEELSAPSAETILFSFGFESEDIQHTYDAIDARSIWERHPRFSSLGLPTLGVMTGMGSMLSPLWSQTQPPYIYVPMMLGLFTIGGSLLNFISDPFNRILGGYSLFDFEANWAIKHEIKKVNVCVKYIQALTMAASKGL